MSKRQSFQEKCSNKQLKKVKRGQLVYAINEDKQTVDIINADNAKNTILIPYSIQYDDKEYIVERIMPFSFQNSKVKSIQFSPSSALKIIENDAFARSPIQSISLPSSVSELKDRWCRDAFELKDVTVSPGNQVYKQIDEKTIVGKIDSKSDEYDALIFVCRDVCEVTIPPNIRYIASYSLANLAIEYIKLPSHVSNICEGAFYCCYKLQTIEIPADTELKIIERNAFNGSSVESISIPSDIVELQEGWCCGTSSLTKVSILHKKEQNIFYYEDKFILRKSDAKSDEYDILLFARRDIKAATIPPNIKRISSHAFAYSSIKNICIPPQITQIGEFAFLKCNKLKSVEISKNSELQLIDEYAFAESSIESFFIPPHITQISNFTFSWCKKLQKVEFAENSELRIIGKNSFSESSIGMISIPHCVTQICEFAFSNCTNLQTIEIPADSELQIIENNVFAHTKIKRITFPSNMIELKQGWCCETPELAEISIIPRNEQNIFLYDGKIIIGKSDTKNDTFDILHFAVHDIKSVTIPQSIKQIAPYSFQKSSIEKVIFSPQINQICKYAFSECSQIQNVEIPSDSELQIIEEYAFFKSSLRKIFIPRQITKICDHTFYLCEKLKFVDFALDSKLKYIDKYAFTKSFVESIIIPSNVTKINENAFSFCLKLQIIEIENPELVTVNKKQMRFKDCKAIVMIPVGLNK